MLTPTEAKLAAEHERANILQRRVDIADEMLDKLINDIGTGAGVAPLRKQALDIKHELRGLAHLRAEIAGNPPPK